MPLLARFEHPECWQQAINIVVDTYHFSSNGNFVLDSSMKDQLRKTALSVASHISEGKERDDPSEGIQRLCSAKESAAELRTLFFISREVGYLAEGEFLEFEDKIIRLIAAIDQSIESLRRRS